MQRLIKVWQVGKIAYSPSLQLQKRLAKAHQTSPADSDILLLIEHSPVYTVGIRSKEYTQDQEEQLRKTGAEFHRTNRGGLITYHGPGQLVVYPIINLKHFNGTLRWYVCHIEKTVVDLCVNLGLDARTSSHTGVWIGDNKICAIGVHGSRFITSHGFALNCCTDLSWYDHIVPCGIKDKGVTSLSEELNRNVAIEEVVPLFLQSFSKVFGCLYTNFQS